MTTATSTDLDTAPTTATAIINWIHTVADLTTPDTVVWCDGTDSEWPRLTTLLVDKGTFAPLSKKPNSFRCTAATRAIPATGRDRSAAVTHKSTKLGVLGFGAIAFSVAALTFGAGTAGADQNNPSMTEVGGNQGVVTSRQSAATSGADHCMVNPGTLSTVSTVTSDIGAPTQKAEEAGPSWVGSDGWQAMGQSRSNPFGGAFDPRNTSTGPQCGPGSAGGF